MHATLRPGLLIAVLGLLPGVADAQPEFQFSVADATILYDVSTGAGSGTVSLFNVQTAGAIANVGGWSLGLSNDTSILDATAIEQGSYIQALDGGNGPDLWNAAIQSGGITISCVYSLLQPIACTYESQKEIAVVFYETVPGAVAGSETGVSTVLSFTSSLGFPPVTTVVVVNASIYIPDQAPGTVTLLRDDLIARGDANGNGAPEALADAVYAAEYLFGGGPAPPCLDSMDANDDGNADIADVVRLLMWGYSAASAPSPPFPDCGIDPTGDALPCDMPVCP